ncbi:MAG: hypothetical protein AAGA35_04280 [Patescibacteria group bacterium]
MKTKGKKRMSENQGGAGGDAGEGLATSLDPELTAGGLHGDYDLEPPKSEPDPEKTRAFLEWLDSPGTPENLGGVK